MTKKVAAPVFSNFVVVIQVQNWGDYNYLSLIMLILLKMFFYKSYCCIRFLATIGQYVHGAQK